MGPIEGGLGAIFAVFVFLGAIRGFLKELGLTTVMIVWLFGMDQIIPRLEDFIRQPGTFLERIGVTEATRNIPLSLLFLVITLVVVYIAYQGETLAFEGSAPKGLQGVLLSLVIGAINGYLVVGALWWILNRYDYALLRAQGAFVNFSATSVLSPSADQIVNQLRLLPPDLLGGGTDAATSLGVLPLLVVTMILLRVVR